MNTTAVNTSVSLNHKTTLRVPDAAGLEITCTRGSLWLTLDDDRRDIILTAGSNDDTFRTNEHRVAIVYALADSLLKVCAANERAVFAQYAKVNERCAVDGKRTMLPLVAA